MKIFKRLLIFLFVVFLLFGGAGFVFLKLKKETLTKLLVSELNKELLAPVQVQEIRFGFLKNFPNLTAGFKEVVILSSRDIKSKTPGTTSDTLLYIKHLNITVQSLKLIRKQLVIHRFVGENGFLKLEKYATGGNNFTIFRTHERQNENGYSIEPENVILRNLTFTYHDFYSGFFLKAYTNETKFIKKPGQPYILVKSNSLVSEIHNQKDLCINKEFPIRLNLKATRGKNSYKVYNSNLSIAGFDVNINGTFDKQEKWSTHLKIEAQQQPVKNLLKILPLKPTRKLSEVVIYSGKISLKGQIDGKISNQSLPHLIVNFSLNQGKIGDPGNRLELSEIECAGSYDNGQKNNLSTSRIVLNSFHLEMNRETLAGSLQLSNFVKPDFSLRLNGNIQLKTLQTFLPDTVLEYLTGIARVNLKISGSLDQLRELKKGHFTKLEHVGHVELQICHFKLKGSPIVFSDISGSLMAEKTLWVDGMSLKVGGQALSLSGEILNLFSFLSGENKALEIRGDLSATDFNLTPLLQEDLTSVNHVNIRKLKFPSRFITNLKFTANRFSYHKFQTSNLHGQIHYDRGSLLIDSLKFQTMDGFVTGHLIAFQEPTDSILVQVYSKLNHIDIHQLFKDLNNFGQTFITHRNLEGEVTGTVHFYSIWGPDLKISNQSILTESHLNIKNGRLVDFEPIQSLSRFIALDELKDIRFSALENEIYINNETVTIPQTDIHSSAFNMNVSGTHQFNNHYVYNVRVLLSEILASKAKRKKKENEEFGVIEEDGLGQTSLYFKITGDGDQVDVTYDANKWSKKLKKGFKQQGKELKDALRKEFGWFKKDSVVVTGQKEKTPFSIRWEENKSVLPDTVDRKKKKFNVSWEEELADTIPRLPLNL